MYSFCDRINLIVCASIVNEPKRMGVTNYIAYIVILTTAKVFLLLLKAIAMDTR